MFAFDSEVVKDMNWKRLLEERGHGDSKNLSNRKEGSPGQQGIYFNGNNLFFLVIYCKAKQIIEN